MELLLKRDRLGRIVGGSDEQLLARAFMGDDIIAHEESSIFSCHIVFASYVVGAGRVSGLSLPHLAFGDLRDEGRLQREPMETIQYIYDSQCKNLLCRDILDQGQTVTEVHANNPHYASFTWYSTRRYRPVGSLDLSGIKRLGDQFKARLEFSKSHDTTRTTTLIMQPDIIYFPHSGRDFLIKSSAMILPAAFCRDPFGYGLTGRPLIAHTHFSLAYLNLDSEGLLTIVHTQRFTLNETVEQAVERAMAVSQPVAPFMGRQSRSSDAPTGVTQARCAFTLLAPEGE
jgi:hypothetical protein